MESNLMPCPFCGGRPKTTDWGTYGKWCIKHTCKGGSGNGRRISVYASCYETEADAIEVWNRRTPEIVKVETNFYDKEEIYPDCTVQVLTNTATGDVSVGWWENEV